MKRWINGALFLLGGLLGAGILALLAAPPQGEPVVLQPPPTAAPLEVYVTGAVKNPGVYQLPIGSRVQDAINAAGGWLPKADHAGLNLAARLTDGAQIQVGSLPTQAPVGEITSQPAPARSFITTPTSIPPAKETSAPEGKIDLNTASQSELETLSGIGPVTAQKIIAYRDENGPFTTIEEIMNVSGIGPATFDKIKGQIIVSNP